MKLISKNRRAHSDYQIDKEYEVGIVLKWHEVKSIKGSKVNIKDSIVRLDNKELWIVNMDIPLYEKTSHILVAGYEAKKKRKLLANKKEIGKISAALDNSSNVVIPLEIYITSRGLIKLKIAIAKRMRKVEKKQVLKEKDIKRQMDREIKHIRP